MALPKIKKRLYSLLRRSEKYTKTDMVYFASGNFWLFANRIMATASGILLSVAFANLLPKETFGTYKYVLSIAGFLTAFSLSGMGTAVSRAVARGRGNVVGRAFRTVFKWSIPAAAAAALAGAYYLLRGNANLGISLLIISAAFPLINAGGLAKPFLLGNKDFKRIALYGVPRNIFSIIVIVLTIWLTDSVIVLVAVYFMANAAASLATYFFSLRAHRPNISNPDEKELSETVRYAKHLSVMGFFTQAASQLDNLLLWHFAGPIQVALYAFAARPARELQNLTGNIFPLAMPKFAGKNLDEVKKMLPLRMLQMLAIITPVVIAYILAAPYIFKLLFPKYMDSVLYSQIFSLVLLFQPKGLISTALDAHAKIKQKYLLTFSSAGVKIFFFIALIPKYGILGIILSFLLAEAATAAILIYMFKKL